MLFYKIIKNGYITAIGTGGSGTEITEAEYNEIMLIIQNKPPRTETADYYLKQDLTWEAFEVEPIDPSDEPLDPQEALDILMGGNDG